MEFQYEDPVIRFAISTGAFTTLVALLVILLMLVVRVSRGFEQWTKSTLATKWLQVLAVGGDSHIQADLTSLGRRPALELLRQWSVAYAHTRTHDDADAVLRRRHLISSAKQVRMDFFAMELLETGTNEEVMAAVVVLGQLGIEKAWLPLKRRSAETHPFLSAMALEALVRIDADRAIPVLVNALTRHAEWPDHVLSRILGTLSETHIHATIAGVVDEGHFDVVLHLFRALERLDNPSADVVLEWLMVHLRSVDDLMACCYAALQEARLDTVLRVYREGMERIVAFRSLAAEHPDYLVLTDQPAWIRTEVLTGIEGRSDHETTYTHTMR